MKQLFGGTNQDKKSTMNNVGSFGNSTIKYIDTTTKSNMKYQDWYVKGLNTSLGLYYQSKCKVVNSIGIR